MNNTIINETLKDLDRILQHQTQMGLYGIFYKGELLILSKKRVYLKAGIAKSRLVSKIVRNVDSVVNMGLSYADKNRKSYPEVRKIAREITDQLIKDGDIEIKQL